MLHGTWIPVTAELNGQPMPEATLRSTKLVLEHGRYFATIGGVVDRGTLALDLAREPKEMDITGIEGPNKGRTIPAIYDLTGDILTVCYNLSGGQAPSEFRTVPNSNLFLVTYKRVAG